MHVALRCSIMLVILHGKIVYHCFRPFVFVFRFVVLSVFVYLVLFVHPFLSLGLVFVSVCVSGSFRPLVCVSFFLSSVVVCLGFCCSSFCVCLVLFCFVSCGVACLVFVFCMLIF